MTHRIAFEALDRTLCDILSMPSNSKKKVPFGGKVVILGGDLWQTLPVIQGGSRSEIVDSAIINSLLWSHVVVLHLTINMRLSTHDLSEKRKEELADFSQWMLAVGEGEIDATTKEDEIEPSWINIPEEFLLRSTEDKIACMVDVVYSDLPRRYMDIDYLREQAVLTLTNDISDSINNYVVSLHHDDKNNT
jgi:ATP-dependent DNA helicase PIF1